MATTAKAPGGLMLMLRSLGVDPGIFDQVANSVKSIASSLERIEEKQDRILALLENKNVKLYAQTGASNGDGG